MTYRTESSLTALFDLGCAAQNIMIAAQAVGLSTIPLISPRTALDILKLELKIPDTESFYVAIAVGYADSNVVVATPKLNDPIINNVEFIY
jgi:nitroreductase